MILLGFMQKIKNNLGTIFLIFLVLVYLLTRFYHLTVIPIFGDEAIYLNWSQTIAEDPKQLFIPLSDGKQPLFMWFTAIATFFIKQPLMATRVIAIAAGLLTLIGIYLIVKKLAGYKASLFAIALYIITPMAFFYDRIGEPDGLLATFGVWTMYFGLKLLEKSTIRNAILLGGALGLGILAKSPAIFYVVMLPFLLLANETARSSLMATIKNTTRYVFLSLVVAAAIVATMKISPLFHVIGQRTNDFVFSPTHLLTSPFNPLIPRIPLTFGWLNGYLTSSIVGVAIIGLVLGIYYRKHFVWSLFAWFAIPMLIEMALAKGFTPRYYLFAIPPFIMLAGLGLYWLILFLQPYIKYFSYIAILLFVPAVYFVFLLMTSPQQAPIPEKERAGYLEDWTSGYGIAEITSYLKKQPSGKIILVGTEGHFGTLPDGLIAYNRQSPNIHVEGMGQPAEIYRIPAGLYGWIGQNRNNLAYLVVNKSRMHVDKKEQVHLLLLASYPKAAGPNGQDALLFYQVQP